MKLLKTIVFSFITLFVIASFSQCSSSKKLQEKAPVSFGDVYFQTWVAGVQGGGSGINIFIPIEDSKLNEIKPDSVYFRGMVSKLETKTDSTLFIGRFSTAANQEKDIIMSNEPNAEYGNTITETSKNFPFQLKDDECIISYKSNNKTAYYKIENVKEKDRVNYPSAPPKQNQN